MTTPDTRIVSHFPRNKQPRPVQTQVLTQVEQLWDQADVLVINLPVASGKSLIAQTIAVWAMKHLKTKSRVIVPNNILVEQYVKDFPHLHTLPAATATKCIDSIAVCPETRVELYSHSCSQQKSSSSGYCADCPYVREKRKGYATPYGVYNFYTYIANQYYRPILIVDEAHNLIQTLRDLNGRRYWQHEYDYPPNVSSYGQLLGWVTRALERFPEGRRRDRLEELKNELVANRTQFIVDRCVEEYRGDPRDVIKLLPVDVSSFGGLLWPANKVQKIVLLSATITRKDIESLGLDKKRVVFLEAPSPIPVERRPIYLDCSLNLSFKYQMQNLSAVAEWIEQKLKENPEKGLIHCTYGLANLLRPLLSAEGSSAAARLRWHSKEDKMDQYAEFRSAPEGAVLMACGLYEGIDLPDDLGRWQALLKVPYPSLADPALQHLAEADPEWYANETIRVVAQMSGRVCRHPEDYGKTYILDSTFRKLYDEWGNLFPDWFKEAVVK